MTMTTRNGTHPSSVRRDDDFWRRTDELLGFAPPTALPITNRTPIIDVVPIQGTPIDHIIEAAADQQAAADLSLLEARLSEALARVASAERHQAARDAALRAVVETFEQQLSDMEASHTRRLTTIRIAAENEARRILAEADTQAELLAQGAGDLRTEGTDLDGR